MLPRPMPSRKPKIATPPASPQRPGALQLTLTRTGQTLRAAPGARFAADTLGGIRAVIHGFRGERISLRAAALTYISIFSLVPLFTVALVLLESLHQESFHLRMEQFIQEILAPGIRDETAVLLRSFIERASSLAAGGVGFLVLAFSGGMLLKNLDASLNEIWNIRKKRPWHVRVVIYAFILLLGPVLVAVSLAGTAGIRELLIAMQAPYVREVTTFGSVALAITAFTSLYFLAPNAPVRFRSALAGGLVAGAAWDLAKLGYTAFGAKIFRYNPVYGSLGAAPLFLAWIYVSWLLVLFGARLAYAVEHASVNALLRDLGAHPRARELIATRIAEELTLAHLRGTVPPTPRELSRRLDLPEERIRDATERMERAGLITTSARGALLPARLPDQLTLAQLSEAVGGLPPPVAPERDKEEEFRAIEPLFSTNDAATRRSLGRITWAELAGRHEEKTAPNEAVTPSQSAAVPSGRRNP